MPSTWLGSEKYQFDKSLVWLDQKSNKKSRIEINDEWNVIRKHIDVNETDRRDKTGLIIVKENDWCE